MSVYQLLVAVYLFIVLCSVQLLASLIFIPHFIDLVFKVPISIDSLQCLLLLVLNSLQGYLLLLQLIYPDLLQLYLILNLNYAGNVIRVL